MANGSMIKYSNFHQGKAIIEEAEEEEILIIIQGVGEVKGGTTTGNKEEILFQMS